MHLGARRRSADRAEQKRPRREGLTQCFRALSTTSGSRHCATASRSYARKKGSTPVSKSIRSRALDASPDLCNKGPVFDRVYTHPKVLAAVHHVISRPFKLSSLNARDALPGEGLQGMHADWGADYDGQFHVCNSVWLLDDFSEENGCTRLVPGSHKGQHPSKVLTDAQASHPR